MAVVIVRPLIAASISFVFLFSFFSPFFFFLLLLFLLFRFGCLDDSGGEFAMTDLCVREHSSCAYGEW